MDKAIDNKVSLMATNKDSVLRYEANGQEIELNFSIIKDLIAVGNNVNDRDVLVFMNKCKFSGLNPFLNEAYLIKYGDIVQMVTGKETFGKKSDLDPRYKGFKAGVIVVDGQKKIVYREGTIYIKGHETLLGGWCEVYKEGQERVRVELLLSEYSTGKSAWSSKPALMIRKCAYVGAHREAFPNLLGGEYIQEELQKSEMQHAEKAPATDDQVSEAMKDLRKKDLMDKINKTEQTPVKATTITVSRSSDEFNGLFRCRGCGSIKIKEDMKKCPNEDCGIKLVWVD